MLHREPNQNNSTSICSFATDLMNLCFLRKGLSVTRITCIYACGFSCKRSGKHIAPNWTQSI